MEVEGQETKTCCRRIRENEIERRVRFEEEIRDKVRIGLEK